MEINKDLLEKLTKICEDPGKLEKVSKTISELATEIGDIDIRPISVDELCNMKFFIPDYQRGYRWEPKQVEELLQDILDFMLENEEGSYYIQPLVVKKNESEGQVKWEVIDGQQRLTTIYLITKYLTGALYKIEYATRDKSQDFLYKITIKDDCKKESSSNIDFTHMYEAYEAIDKWVSENLVSQLMRGKFIETLRNRVKFIWYEPKTVDAKEVFTRLNKGRISLTNAELIKALLLNSANYDKGPEIERLQKEIPEKWHEIETTLQNDAFWAFISKKGDNRDSRIDLIFEVIHMNNLLSGANKEEDYGKDGYNTFRYFYSYFRKIGFSRRALDLVWEQIWHVYSILTSWYEDDIIYNYVGYLVKVYTSYKVYKKEQKGQQQTEDNDSKWNSSTVLYNLIKEWGKCRTKTEFIKKLRKQIVEYLKAKYEGKSEDDSFPICNGDGSLKIENLLEIQYETEKVKKRECCPILLLHNIQTIVTHIEARRKKNENYIEKFPFHLFDAESWDVEHVASATTNDLTEKGQQKEWIRNVLPFVVDSEKRKIQEETHEQTLDLKKLSKKLKEYHNKPNAVKGTFQDLYNEVCSEFNVGLTANTEKEFEKNQIWNYVLLDSHTNRSYGNNLFSIKSRIIKEKENGKRTICKIDTLENTEESVSTFVPICTKLVFYKYYTPMSTDSNFWTVTDAENYKGDIKTNLEKLTNDEPKQ